MGADEPYQKKTGRWINEIVSIIIVALIVLSGSMTYFGIIAFFSQKANHLLLFGITFNVVIYPVIYCTQIKELKSEINSLF